MNPFRQFIRRLKPGQPAPPVQDGSSVPHPLPEPPHRRATLMALLVVTVFGALVFGVLNGLRGAYLLASVEAAMGTFALGLMVIVRRTTHLRCWTLAYLLPFFSAMLLALATPVASATVFVWVLLIPVIAHLLLGRWLGLAIATVFLLGAGYIYLARFSDDPGMVNVLAMANVCLASVVILALSHVAEYTRERSERKLREQASTDALTGLANRSHMKAVFQRERDRALRRASPLSVLLLDLDHFKQVNDRHGHDAGDAALVQVAQLLRSRLRTTDLACRHGGEEFAVVLPDTDIRAAAELAEVLRRCIAAAELTFNGQAIALTASFGVSALGNDGRDLDELLSIADRRLFRAKHSGRNTIVSGAGDSGLAAIHTGLDEPASVPGQG